ncbi:Hypothetical predicted protein, partial [Marmota monax]
MAASDVAVGIIFLSQTVVGALGNSSLLLHYLVLYFTGVSRCVSIGSTSLLSIFQAITISPRDSRWAELKVKAPSVRHDTTTDSLHAALLTFPDALCVGLMLCASSSMVLILHRHKQRMQHVHKSSSPRSSPESRATKTILLL